MELQPEDLGQRRAIAVMRRRAGQIVQSGQGVSATLPAFQDTPPPLGLLGRFWTQGTRLAPPVAAATAEAAGPMTNGLTYGLVFGSLGFWMPGVIALLSTHSIVLGDTFVLAGALMSSLGICIPKMLIRKMAAKPVSVTEIDALLSVTQMDALIAGAASTKPLLEKTYLNAVKDALMQPIPTEAASGVRAALRAMGEAIDRLPRQSLPPIDGVQLHAEAQALLTQAAQEADPVIAASRQRQAEAVMRSAEAGERAETMQRRVSALRDELTAQAQSLRLGLTAFQSGTGDIAGLTQLADTVRGVATEANALSDARAEVDSAVIGYLQPTNDAEPALRLIQG